jgi:hypothetical protein
MRFALIALVAACITNDAVTISDAEYDDIAIFVATTLRTDDGGGELGALADGRALLAGTAPEGFVLDGDNYVGARGAVEYRYTMACVDANLASLPTCGAATATATFSVEWAGFLAVEYEAEVLGRTGVWTFKDVGTPAATVTGSALTEYFTEYESPVRGLTTSYEVENTAQYLDFQLVDGDIYPRAGQIRYEVEAERTRDRENNRDTRDFEMAVVAQFSGTTTAVLELDDEGTGDGPRRTYDLDLATGALVLTSGIVD